MLCDWGYMLKKIRVGRSGFLGFFNTLWFLNYFFFCTNGIWQNLAKFQHTKVINEEVKPSQSHEIAQKIQIPDFLPGKYQKLFYLQKYNNFKKRVSINVCRFLRKKGLFSVTLSRDGRVTANILFFFFFWCTTTYVWLTD